MTFLLRAARCVIAAMVVAVFVAAPVMAAGTHKPDGWVRYQGFRTCGNSQTPGPWKGKNIYNTTARNQKATHTIGGAYFDGDYFCFTITIENDGVSDRFKVRGGGAHSQTRYFKGSTNITSQVKAGTYQTATLAAGAKTTITVHIDPSWSETVLVTLTSAADSTKKDAVKAGLKNVGCGC